MNFMPKRVTTSVLEALPGKMGLDAIVAMSPENFGYVSGAYVLTVSLIRPRQAFAVLPAKAKPFIVVCSIEKSLTEAESWISDVRTYTEFVDDPIDALVAALQSAGIDSGKIGIDKTYIPIASWERLTAKLPGVKFVDTTEDIAAIRVIKSSDEIDLLEEITKQTHRATLDAMAASKIGDSERDIANRIASNIINNGADGTLFMCLASGQRSGQPHTMASPDVFPKAGEVIRFDVGGTYGPWASDFARTYSAGDPTKLQQEVYSNLIEIQTATIEKVRPGALAEDLFYFCKNAFEKMGMPFHMPHIGHSFGIELHENPMLRPGDKTELKPGMVLNIEPMARASEGSVFHTEDLVVVTDNGCRILTLGLAPSEIPVLGQVLKY